jgi:hypothetical protein
VTRQRKSPIGTRVALAPFFKAVVDENIENVYLPESFAAILAKGSAGDCLSGNAVVVPCKQVGASIGGARGESPETAEGAVGPAVGRRSPSKPPEMRSMG